MLRALRKTPAVAQRLGVDVGKAYDCLRRGQAMPSKRSAMSRGLWQSQYLMPRGRSAHNRNEARPRNCWTVIPVIETQKVRPQSGKCEGLAGR